MPSYNQPKFNGTAMWNSHAITFATSNAVGTKPISNFVTKNNTVYVLNRDDSRIIRWLENSINPTELFISGMLEPYSFFISTDDDIYVDNGKHSHRVEKWVINENTSTPVMDIAIVCDGLFVDINNTVYCSVSNIHQVVMKSQSNPSSVPTIAAGAGCPGSNSNMLDSPHGIFVDINFDLYVADTGNSRIQLFQQGQFNGITKVGNGAPETITLFYPTEITLDADKYIFILDRADDRIIGEGPNGFRCLVGCLGRGSASNQLHYPRSMAFDSYGNLFVTDTFNDRIQKFILLTNSCGRCEIYFFPFLYFCAITLSLC